MSKLVPIAPEAFEQARKACAEHIWRALVNLRIGYEVRHAITEAIKHYTPEVLGLHVVEGVVVPMEKDGTPQCNAADIHVRGLSDSARAMYWRTLSKSLERIISAAQSEEKEEGHG